MPVISWLPTGKGGRKEEWIDVTVNGAAYETVTLTASDGTTSECVTDANGSVTAAVKVGETYTLVGSVSGYTSKQQTVYADSTDLYAMPDSALYWYGYKDNRFVDKNYTVSGYTHIAYRDDGTSLYLDANNSKYECNIGAVVDLTNISRIGFIAKGYYSASQSEAGIWGGVCDNPPIYDPQGSIVGNNTVGTAVIDVSDISGEHLVSVATMYMRYATLYALWLE